MIFYKATRTTGRDFYSDTVDYAAALASGQPLPTIEAEYRKCCTGSVYHAADVPAETLSIGSWPCRLFEVIGEPVAQDGHKYGFATLSVVREVEAWQVFGPNGAAVVALIERARTLTLQEVTLLAAARDAARVAAWNAARNAARDAAKVAAWDAGRAAAWNAAWNAAAWNAAARDAAWALVVRDLISEEKFRALTRSWVSVMGEI